MKKLLVYMIVMLTIIAPVVAQDSAADIEPAPPAKPWTIGGAGSLTFNQTGLYNWAAGGQSNLTLLANLNAFANRKWDNGAWDNALDLSYGFIKNNYRFDPGARIAKAADKIEFNSKYGRKSFSDKLFYTGLLTFRTQFAPGRANIEDNVYISKALAPAYLIAAIGMDYKPNDKLSLFLAPISGKMTIVTDDSLSTAGAFGVNQINPETMMARPGTFAKTRFEFGATFKAKLKTDIMENISLESNLELFSNYIDRPQNIDMRWTNNIVAKVNKFITVNFFTDMIYDHDINIARRDNETGVGLLSVNPEPVGADATDPAVISGDKPATLWRDPANPGGYVTVPLTGPILQFMEIFGVGFSYKF
jgi:hypothetical protein